MSFVAHVTQPEYPVVNDRTLLCLAALQQGIHVEQDEVTGAVAGECGCGHPFVASTYEGAHAAIAAHFAERRTQ